MELEPFEWGTQLEIRLQRKKRRNERLPLIRWRRRKTINLGICWWRILTIWVYAMGMTFTQPCVDDWCFFLASPLLCIDFCSYFLFTLFTGVHQGVGAGAEDAEMIPLPQFEVDKNLDAGNLELDILDDPTYWCRKSVGFGCFIQVYEMMDRVKCSDRSMKYCISAIILGSWLLALGSWRLWICEFWWKYLILSFSWK